jgi:hypothetical protein
VSEAGRATSQFEATVPPRWAGRTAGAVLLLTAGVVLLLQVQVHRGQAASRSCGSGWDVVAGRVGWPQWWSQDMADPAAARAGPPVRTLDCPGAVNRRIVASGGLALGAVVAVSVGELAARRREQRRAQSERARRVRVLGMTMTWAGGVLTVAGVAGIAALVADPRAALFAYVDRPVVVLVGSLLLLPAILLVAFGRAASLISDHMGEVNRADDAT